MNTATQLSSSQRTYYLPYRFFYMFLILACSLLLPVITVWLELTSPYKLDSASLIVLIIGSAIMLILGGFLSVGTLNIRLVTSAEGIAYYSLGYGVRSSWDNVIGVGDVWNGRSQVRGLLLRKPSLEMNPALNAMVKALPFLRVITTILMILAIVGGSSRVRVPYSSSSANVDAQAIPVGTFVKDWESSFLGEDIRRYAPQAFAR